MSHSPVSPSSAGTWVHCNGMVNMIKDIPNTKSDSSIEGDTAHWLASEMIMTALSSDPATGMIGITAPTGHIVDKEMFDYVAPYVQDVLTVVGMDHRDLVHVEESIQIPRIHAQAHGTPDCWYYDDVNRIVYIWDLKYGWGIVEVYRNWQMMMYAIGVVDAITDSDGHQEQSIHVNMRLAQPRPHHEDGPIREWGMPASELRPYANQLESAARQAMDGTGKLCSGEHCKYCLARPTCPADRYAAMNALDVAEMQPCHEVLNHDYELDMLERAKNIINQRYDAQVEYVTQLIKNGTPVSGRSLKPTPGRGSTWIKPVEEIISLGQIFNIGLEKPTAILTPNQAIKAGIPKEMVAGYSQRKPSGLKLVKDDLRKIQEDFKK